MANAYKCDFCGTLTEGSAGTLKAEIYGNERAHHRSSPFVGTLSISRKQGDYGNTTDVEVCPPCIRKFAQRIAEGK